MTREPNLDAKIDQVLQKAIRKIEGERRRRADRGLDPEGNGLTKTEQILADAMLGKVSLEELAEAVGG